MKPETFLHSCTNLKVPTFTSSSGLHLYTIILFLVVLMGRRNVIELTCLFARAGNMLTHLIHKQFVGNI